MGAGGWGTKARERTCGSPCLYPHRAARACARERERFRPESPAVCVRGARARVPWGGGGDVSSRHDREGVGQEGKKRTSVAGHVSARYRDYPEPATGGRGGRDAGRRVAAWELEQVLALDDNKGLGGEGVKGGGEERRRPNA